MVSEQLNTKDSTRPKPDREALITLMMIVFIATLGVVGVTCAYYLTKDHPPRQTINNVVVPESVEYEVEILPPYPKKLTLVVSDTTIYVTSEKARVRIIKNKNKE